MKKLEYKTYWAQRELARIKKGLHDDAEYNKELLKMYNRTMDSIVKSVQGQYLRYAESEGLTYEEAMLKIDSFDVTSFYDKAKTYVENMDFSDQANRELKAYNLKSRVTRMENMKREIMLETLSLADKENTLLYERLVKEAESEVTRQAGLMKLTRATQRALIVGAKKIIDSSFHGATFSERIWANQSELRSRLQVGLERSILQGENPTVWARSFTELVRKEMGDTGKDNAFFKAKRLAVTESARIQTEVQLASFQAGGFDKYVFICEPTACHMCVPFHLEVFELGQGPEPPIHPFCRCSIAGHMDEG